MWCKAGVDFEELVFPLSILYRKSPYDSNHSKISISFLCFYIDIHFGGRRREYA